MLFSVPFGLVGLLGLLGLLGSLSACSQAPSEPEVETPNGGLAIETPEVSGPQPWTSTDLPSSVGATRFVVMSDRTGGERPGVLAEAVERVNLLRPDFVVSVGDLIEGFNDDRDAHRAEWDELEDIVSRLDMPFFFATGNHDVSNQESLDVWRERHGPTYYHFRVGDLLFLIVDTEDPPPPPDPEMVAAGPRLGELSRTDHAAFRRELAKLFDHDGTQDVAISNAQIEEHERVLRDNPARWTFVILHKPAWQGDPHPNFLRLEAALADRDYTMLAGHIHNYRRTSRNGRDYIRLGATGGSYHHPDDAGTYDHVLLVTLTDEGPTFANLLLEGILDVEGRRQHRFTEKGLEPFFQ